MAELIRMPKMSDTMTEGVIAEWHKKVGDKVKSGDVLAEVETDKATMDLEAYEEGTLLYIGVEKGSSVPVDGVLAIIGADGEDYKALLNGSSGGSQEAPAAETPKPAPADAPAPSGDANKAEVATNLPDQKAISAAPAENVNASVIRMPKMSDTMTEGTLVTWHKKEGDTVKAGDVLAEVETDKATMDLEAYEEGTLLYIGVKEGSVVAVDEIIAVVGEKGANFKVLVDGSGSTAAPAASTDSGNSTAEQNPEADVPANAATDLSYGGGEGDNAESNGRVKASPLAKRIAEEKGINLAQVQGTGPEGRIVKSDVESFVPGTAAPQAKPAQPAAQPAAPAPADKPAPAAPAPSPAPVAAGDFEDIPVSQMRKTIARRLGESMFSAPHFYLTMEINMDKAMELRGTVNGVSPVKISFNDFVIKACALALKQHPNVNASWLGDKIRKYKYVNIGVAVAVEDGLLVPVVRNADQKTLSTISGEVKDLAGKAKDKKLQPKDWEGSTFSISNLGMFGIDEFTAIINPPDACILAVGAIKQTVKVEDGEVKPTNVMKVTLSCDHRAVDGATGAAFLQAVKELLENPMRMLV
ncbi:pyruvate dehydrogenase complex dihydrolipoamide acetyltransferase [Spirosoma utsteinense]|uniref:Acetyltransferase component of pyruvate dehydrogenase complex n=1 Tax=Spirosoma utsteinense TaxID=2585773 RepID=A0ABR6W1R8_9BACT|nr:pyruvate dehydrogenase complex dihydrolipoamide acetyltransferase [Spirosoma utsteinense]MBC3785237.1 pyruvate dehydrogenase E2 component (dihydrolipoamide acetyltransferase) [Spirosoma utsteinense]MBC3790537.1 pyruvate dehydrogenase E2 component (dihydrolipoamide acetyltransferase) [Spirosoma utsteinense]